MKLTKDQRFTAYCIMLQEAEDDMKLTRWERIAAFHGFCNMILFLFEINDNILEPFDELKKKKPEFLDGNYWFDKYEKGWGMRIELLKQCISETSNF